MEIEFLNEHERYYEALIGGKNVILYKVDKDKIQQDYLINLKKVSKTLSLNNIIPLYNLLKESIKNTPNVDQYEKIADSISIEIDKLYYLTKSDKSSIFHHPYKQINPAIYGKAQTFMKNIKFLFEDLIYIKQEILKREKE